MSWRPPTARLVNAASWTLASREQARIALKVLSDGPVSRCWWMTATRFRWYRNAGTAPDHLPVRFQVSLGPLINPRQPPPPSASGAAVMDSHKSELIADRVWRTRAQLERATVDAVHPVGPRSLPAADEVVRFATIDPRDGTAPRSGS